MEIHTLILGTKKPLVRESLLPLTTRERKADAITALKGLRKKCSSGFIHKRSANA